MKLLQSIPTFKNEDFKQLSYSILETIGALDLFQYQVIKPKNIQFDWKAHKVDQISKRLLTGHEFEKTLEPVCTIGDGNCMFRAASKCLYGTEKFHVELRARCVVEIIVNLDAFVDPQNYNIADQVEWLATLSQSQSQVKDDRGRI